MRTSSRMSAKSCFSTSASACRPDRADTRFSPSGSSVASNASKFAGWSSTISRLTGSDVLFLLNATPCAFTRQRLDVSDQLVGAERLTQHHLDRILYRRIEIHPGQQQHRD